MLKKVVSVKKGLFLISHWSIALTIFSLLIITIGLMVWGSDRGFDITDEGFYLLGSQFPGEVKIWPNMAHYYLSVLYNISCQNVITLRLFGLILTLTSAVVFYLGFHRLAVQLRGETGQTILDRLTAASFICLGAMLYCAWIPIIPSYNTLNAFALTSSAGLLFMAMAAANAKDHSRRVLFGLLFLSGMFIGLSFFAKFTTAVSLGVIYSLSLVIWPQIGLRHHMVSLSVLTIGFCTWLGLHFCLLQSPREYWETMLKGIEYTRTLAGYGLAFLPRYFRELIDLTIKALRLFWVLHLGLLLGFGIAKLIRGYKREAIWLPNAIIFIIFMAAGWVSIARGFHWGGWNYASGLFVFYFAWVFLLVMAVVLSFWYRCDSLIDFKQVNVHRLILFGILLALLPFAGAVGTGNPIQYNTIVNMAPWFGLLLLLFTLLSDINQNRWISRAGILVIGSFACSQIVSGPVIGPYRLNTSILQQTKQTKIGFPTSLLKLDVASSDFFVEIQRIASENGFKPGDDVLAFFNMPGVVFAIGGKSPGMPWYTSSYKGSPLVNEKGLSLVPKERLKRAFILQKSNGSDYMPDLAKFGVNFPGGYELCGEAVWPVTKESVWFWKPRSENKIKLCKQKTLFESNFSNWSGSEVISMSDLNKTATPLSILGNDGDFNFIKIPNKNGNTIRVYPVKKGETGDLVIFFGYWLNNNGFDVSLQPGQKIYFEISARLSHKTKKPSEIIIQDKTEDWERMSFLIDKTSWNQYFAAKKIREGMNEMVFGIHWRPDTEDEWLEIKSARIFTIN